MSSNSKENRFPSLRLQVCLLDFSSMWYGVVATEGQYLGAAILYILFSVVFHIVVVEVSNVASSYCGI